MFSLLQQDQHCFLEEAELDDEPDFRTEGEVRSATRWWSLRDRFSPEDLQTMIDLYKSGTTAKQVADKFGTPVPHPRNTTENPETKTLIG